MSASRNPKDASRVKPYVPKTANLDDFVDMYLLMAMMLALAGSLTKSRFPCLASVICVLSSFCRAKKAEFDWKQCAATAGLTIFSLLSTYANEINEIQKSQKDL